MVDVFQAYRRIFSAEFSANSRNPAVPERAVIVTTLYKSKKYDIPVAPETMLQVRRSFRHESRLAVRPGHEEAIALLRGLDISGYFNGGSRGLLPLGLGDVPFGKFAEMLGAYGEEVRDPAQIALALKRARESVHRLRKPAVINIWVDPREYAPGTRNQTMYK